MKIFVVLLAVMMVSYNSFASNITNYEEAQAYKEAVYYSLVTETKNAKCQASKWTWSPYELIMTYGVKVSVTDGAQPLITLTSDFTKNPVVLDYDIVQVQITTSADYKKIVKAEIHAYAKGKTNVGDLKYPKMIDVLNEIPAYYCNLQI